MKRNAADETSSPAGRTRRRNDAVPALCATALASSYLAAALWRPGALWVVAVTTVAFSCATVLLSRFSRRILVLLLAMTAWLALGFSGAFLLADRPLGGLAWVLVVLFLLPLPLIPWGYAATYPGPRRRQ